MLEGDYWMPQEILSVTRPPMAHLRAALCRWVFGPGRVGFRLLSTGQELVPDAITHNSLMTALEPRGLASATHSISAIPEACSSCGV